MSAAARPPLPEGPVLVVGLARSGLAAARLLRARGVEVVGVDRGEPAGAGALREEGIEVVLGSDGADLVPRVRAVVKSPGVPTEAPPVAAARARGLPVIGELELAWRALGNPFVAVTGTNGKTTTVELLGAIHRAAGVPVAVAGNVGTPLASLPGQVASEAVVVCEASSFQLEDTEAFAPEAGVLLNITPDHLDRHGSMEAYRAAKLRVFSHQGPEDVAVLPPAIDPPPGARARVVRFGGEPGVSLDAEGLLRWHDEALMPAGEVRLRGAHNLQNAMAAAAAALARGIAPGAVREALATFAGVPHRLEEVARADGVLYVNDSKATNPASAAVAIEAFAGGLHLILGGSLKGGGFAELAAPVAARCRAVYLIGEAADRIADDLAATDVPIHRCGTLERAVAAAAAAAGDGEVVLLSPACASFDQFRDYEDRGARFRAIARRLAATG